MKYLLVKEYSKKWNISEGTARNYCSSKKIKEHIKKRWLRDTSLSEQDIVKSYLDYFRIKY